MTKTIKLSTLLSTGKLWEKGEHSRVYLGRIEVAKALGFDWESYKTGNPKHATFDGDKISNNEMWGVLMNIDGAYYDNKRKQLGASDKFLALLSRYDIEIVDDVNVEAEEAGHVPSTIRLTPEQTEMLKDVGGSAFMRTLFDDLIAGTVAIPIDTSRFTDEQKARFIKGWEQAGGPTDDAESDTPWCAPWEWQSLIVVRGMSFEAWGADWFRQCKPEIDAILAEDEE